MPVKARGTKRSLFSSSSFGTFQARQSRASFFEPVVLFCAVRAQLILRRAARRPMLGLRGPDVPVFRHGRMR